MHRHLPPLVFLVTFLLSIPVSSAFADPTGSVVDGPRAGAALDPGTDAGLPVPFADYRNETWPQVDSIRVDRPYANFGGEPCTIRVYLTNPIANHTFVWKIGLDVRQVEIGYSYSLPQQNVTLPPGAQQVVQFQWRDQQAPPYLSYDLTATLLPVTRDNQVVNGQFESDLSGWQVINDNPPGYGVETVTSADNDPDREGHVYSTDYNTYGISPGLRQRVLISPNSDLRIYFRAKMTTEDGFYGIGLAKIILRTDQGGQLILWHSTSGTPADNASTHYVRQVGADWATYRVSLSDLPLPPTTWIEIEARAALISATYGMAETHIYLDDVYISNNDPGTLTADDSFIPITTTTQFVGDIDQALEECLNPQFKQTKVLDNVPFLCGVNIASNMMNNLCAASLWQDYGDNVRSGLAGVRAFTAMYECPLKSFQFHMAVEGVSSETIRAQGALRTVFDAISDQLIHPAVPNYEGLVHALIDIANIPDWPFPSNSGIFPLPPPARPLALVGIHTGVSLSFQIFGHGDKRAERGSCSADSLGMTRTIIVPIAPDSLTIGCMDDSAEVLGDGFPLRPDDTIRMRAVITRTGPADFFALHQTPEGQAVVRLNGLPLWTGDVVTLDLSGPGAPAPATYSFQIDRGGNGTIDSIAVVSPQGAPLGACCADTACIVTTQGNCEVLEDGTFFGMGSNCQPDPCQSGPVLVRGDSDASGELNISDPIYNLAYQFAGGPVPSCMDAADDDDSGEVNISDPIYSLSYQFAGGPPPPAPFPACGSDPTADQIGCGESPSCAGKAQARSAVTQVLDGSKRLLLENVVGAQSDTVSLTVTMVTDVPLAGLEATAGFDPSRLRFVRFVRNASGPQMDFLSARETDPARVRLGGVPDFGLTALLSPGRYEIGRLVFARRGPAGAPNEAVWLIDGRFVGRDLLAYRIEGGPALDPAVPGASGRGAAAGFVIAFPNPYHPNSPIRLRVEPTAGELDIAVYDVHGRRVRSLYAGPSTAALSLAWDGRTEGGYEVAAGLYYVRVRAGSHRGTRSLLLLR